jgi:hypothetical protein
VPVTNIEEPVEKVSWKISPGTANRTAPLHIQVLWCAALTADEAIGASPIGVRELAIHFRPLDKRTVPKVHVCSTEEEGGSSRVLVGRIPEGGAVLAEASVR